MSLSCIFHIKILIKREKSAEIWTKKADFPPWKPVWMPEMEQEAAEPRHSINQAGLVKIIQ